MTVLALKRAGFGYHGRPVLGPLDLALAEPGLVALVGPNGAGKSTLLRLCAGLAAPVTGAVCLDGEPVSRMAPRARARRIAYLAPDGRSAWPLDVRAVVALGRVPFLKPLRRLSEADAAAVERALGRTGVGHLAGRAFNTLSSGEKARVLLARALAGGAEILILDEPVAALDIRHQLGVMEVLRAEADRGVQVLVAVHGLDLAARFADRVLVLEAGKLVADGPPAEALSADVLGAVFGVAAPGGLVPMPFRPLPGR